MPKKISETSVAGAAALKEKAGVNAHIADLASTAANKGGLLVGYKSPGTGAVARTVSAKLGDMGISVLDFIPVSEHAGIRAGSSSYDCAPGIQAAIDFAIHGGGRSKVRVPAGEYNCSKRIHLGYGVDGFVSIVLEGDGYSYGAAEGFNGTGFVFTNPADAGFNFQGARGSVLRGVAIKGLNHNHIESNNLGGVSYAGAADDTVIANWIDPALGVNANHRYSPYCAITIDAYSGVRPATSYPDVAYPPAYVGTPTQYGRAFSSDILIEDVEIRGFVVALAIQPCDADGNADFTTLRRANIVTCAYALSVGNTQSRNVHLDDVKCGSCHTIITNIAHGKKLGQLDGPISNLSFGQCIQLFDITMAYAGPMTVISAYAEGLYSLGNAYSAGSNDPQLHFDGCLFDFGGQTAHRGIPAQILRTQVGAGGNGSVYFNGGVLTGFESVVSFGSTEVMFNGTLVSAVRARGVPAAAEYIALAHNALAGGVVAANFATRHGHRIRFNPYNLDTLDPGPASAVTQEGYVWSDRTYCIPRYVWRATPTYDLQGDLVERPRGAFAYAKAGSSVTLVGRTLTMTFGSLDDDTAMTNGGCPGDALWDDQTGMVFFIRSRSAGVIIAEAQNNYKVVGGVTSYPTAFSTTVGNLYLINCRYFTPWYYMRGDVTTANAIISNVGRDDGYHGAYDTQIVVGDYLFVDGQKDGVYYAGNAKVSARSQVAGTITLTAAAAYIQAKRRLGIWVRKPPANV